MPAGKKKTWAVGWWEVNLRGKDFGRRKLEAVGLMIPCNVFFKILLILFFPSFVEYSTFSPFTLLFIAGKGLYRPPPVATRHHWAQDTLCLFLTSNELDQSTSKQAPRPGASKIPPRDPCLLAFFPFSPFLPWV